MSEETNTPEAEAVAPEAAPEVAAAAPVAAEAQAPSQYGQGGGGFRRPPGGKRFVRRKVCVFCVDKVEYVDYKDQKRIRKFISERGKILPRRISGNCAAHQRMLTVALKRARVIALVPFIGE